MTALYTQYYSARSTPQSEPIPGSKQVPNNAGGYAFAVNDRVRLDRFLILGAEIGCYYVGERKLTVQNAEAVRRCLAMDGPWTVRRIVEISESGRAPKNDPAVFCLALAAGMGDAATQAAAFDALPRVCRIGTHLFQFVENVLAFRGWGRGLRRAVGRWYATKQPRELSYQLAKYQQRNGWSHRDLLRLAHPKLPSGSSGERALALVAGKQKELTEDNVADLAPLLAFEQARRAIKKGQIVRLIREHHLVRECVPTRWLKAPEVWDALLERMPLHALVRNLATMTRVGLLAPLADATRRVVHQLINVERIHKARLHPLAVLMALRTYAAGRGERSRHTWTPVPQIIEALDAAFYAAFANVQPTGKRWLLGIDVSGSMSAPVAGTPMSCCEGATALALVIAHVEPQTHFYAFGDTFRLLPITRRTRLHDALRLTRNVNFGGTDCSLPMRHALAHGLSVDAFVVLTDSETWAGPIHPVQALREYREKTGIPAKLIVVGMTSAGFSIADPDDAGMLDVTGFDVAVPQLMSDFATA